MIKIMRKVKPGERAPWGYAVAYGEMFWGYAYPIGIHLLVQLGHSIYLRIMKGFSPAWWEKEIEEAVSARRKAWNLGRDRLVRDAHGQGCQEGYQEGYRVGWVAALEHMEKQIKEYGEET